MAHGDTAHRLVPPTGMHHDVALLFAALEATRARTRDLLEGLAARELDLRPPGSPASIGVLALHIARVEHVWIQRALLESDLDPRVEAAFAAGDLDSPAAREFRGRDAEHYLAQLDFVRAATESACWRLDADALQRPRRHPWTGETVSAIWILHHLGDHEAHHRGQIALLRRLAGIRAP